MKKSSHQTRKTGILSSKRYKFSWLRLVVINNLTKTCLMISQFFYINNYSVIPIMESNTCNRKTSDAKR
ncbi:hypothetical protein BIY37_07290 [Candidatus Brocadia sapporoensis]|uniref:Uncharacterized protein n=1 Tax=Candidatus Brocadia sapporoensis TaxID=392547 RepID=A0A1V6LZQ6_9BACT|nr:hypothetical protein BIY37_07290 [Candidatus Brocadia sapporoensis]